MTTRQARKIIRRIRQGARYPERTSSRASLLMWRKWRRLMRPLMTGADRVWVGTQTEATILVTIEERSL